MVHPPPSALTTQALPTQALHQFLPTFSIQYFSIQDAVKSSPVEYRKIKFM